MLTLNIVLYSIDWSGVCKTTMEREHGAKINRQVEKVDLLNNHEEKGSGIPARRSMVPAFAGIKDGGKYNHTF